MWNRVITDREIDGGDAYCFLAPTRISARGVLRDKLGRIALLLMNEKGYAKLPGGGVEPGESSLDAFLREIKEETGWTATGAGDLGTICEHKAKTGFCQLSYCLVADCQGVLGETALSEAEKELGLNLFWEYPKEALERMTRDFEACTEYGMRFMLLREREILSRYLSWLISGGECGQKKTELW